MAHGRTVTLTARRARRRRLIGVPPAGSDDFRMWVHWIGGELGTRRAPTLDAHLGAFAATALALGVEPASARIVGDPDAPGVARARAFFQVASALDDDPGPAAA